MLISPERPIEKSFQIFLVFLAPLYVMASIMKSVFPTRIRSDLYSVSWTGRFPCVLSVVSSSLNRLRVRKERRPEYPMDSSEFLSCIFNSNLVPDMGIQHFLQRIFRYVWCSPSVFVVAYVYIDRLMFYHSTFRVTSVNVHRIVITSVMLAAKFLDDVNYNNGFLAEIGGITTKEINKLEVDFLFKLNFRMHVTVSVFQSYCSHLEREVALGGGYHIEVISARRDHDSDKQSLVASCRYGRQPNVKT